jgi:hypothetical protein
MKNGTTETKISHSILSLRYLLLTLSILTIVRCGKSDEGSPSPAPEADKYESYWYYSYEAERVLTAADLSVDDFTPYTHVKKCHLSKLDKTKYGIYHILRDIAPRYRN